MPDRRSSSHSEQDARAVTITTEQLAGALRQPQAYPHTPAEVGFEQTQMSLLFFAGDHVYKVKKPVNLGYLDYSTLEARKRFCEQEVALNRRLCEETYLGIVPIVHAEGGLRVEGDGPAVEYAVKMRRLPQDRMLDRLLEEGEATAAMLEAVARRIAAFHEKAQTDEDISRYGSIESIKYNTDENFDQTACRIGDTISRRDYEAIRAYTDSFMENHANLFERRIERGRIRDCHGDLHAAHVCMTDPVCVYDCIEFNDRFRYGDVASEVAFLAMDLDRLGRRDLSRAFVDAYVDTSGDDDAAALMTFYKCYRAYVRGKVEGFKLGDAMIADDVKRRTRWLARRYFLLARGYATEQGTLIIMSGLTGSGKSTIAPDLARLLSGTVISSDVIRKRLARREPEERVYEPFGKGLYSEEWTGRTYRAMMDAAEPVLAQGSCAILDASFLLKHQRRLAYDLAERTGARPLFVECTAPDEVLRARLAARARQDSASDGRPEILDGQRHIAEEAVEEEARATHVRVRTDQDRERLLEEVWRHL